MTLDSLNAEQRYYRNYTAVSSADYQVHLSETAGDAEWDAFLARTPGGHHVQTSLWAQTKAFLGWQAVRLIVRRDARIVAGAQVLTRSIPLLGSVGYLSKGPVLAENDPLLADLLIAELKRLCRARRIRNLILQPADNGHAFAQRLPATGFQLSPDKLGLSATVVLDLRRDLETLLAEMKSKTRYNVRLGLRRGITVREGTEADLATFYRILSATGQRQNFVSASEAYFGELWDTLYGRGLCKLFLAEFEGEPVSGMLAITFGDTVIYKRGAWSGEHGKLRPNEAMHWTAIEWAKTAGFHYYDFDGINRAVAETIVRDEPLPPEASETVTRFKLGFGGEIRLLPETYSYIDSRLLRWGYNSAYPRVAGWKPVSKTMAWVRKR